MRVGDIFRGKFSLKDKKITLSDIQKHTSGTYSYGSYNLSIVSKRGNVFKNRDLDIDKMVDKSLKNPLSLLR